MDSAEHLTEEQHQRIAALNTASACTSKRVNAFAQAAGMTGGIQVLPGDLVRIAHWITTGESVIITDDDTVVMRDDAGWVKISMEGPAKAPAGDGHLFWAPLGATRDPEFAEAEMAFEKDPASGWTGNNASEAGEKRRTDEAAAGMYGPSEHEENSIVTMVQDLQKATTADDDDEDFD